MKGLQSVSIPTLMTLQLVTSHGWRLPFDFNYELKAQLVSKWYRVDVLWDQPIKLIQVVSTLEFHEY